MELKSALIIFVASWPFVFMWGCLLLLQKRVNREKQNQLNDALRALQFVAMQKRGRLWR